MHRLIVIYRYFFFWQEMAKKPKLSRLLGFFGDFQSRIAGRGRTQMLIANLKPQ
jgi:hypothetical protein